MFAAAIPLAVTIACVLAAGRMAESRARSRFGWMFSAALLGPFPLLALAAMPGKRSA